MTTSVLAIDLGSTGVKVAVVDANGTVLSGAGEVIPTIFTPDGGAEQDPAVWWEAIGRCARQAMGVATLPARQVRLVAVTSQYTSTVAVRADGTPLANAVMWMDQRGRRHNTSVPNAADAGRWIDIHGMAPTGNDDLGHIAFIKAQWPEVFAAAHALVEPMDYIAARLTGHVTATQNTMFPMLSVDNRTWGSCEYSDELLGLSGVERDKLPALVPMGSPRGAITADAAAHLGVDPSAIVMDATIDSVTSAIGTGTVDATGCGLIIGTTTVMVTHLPDKRHDMTHGLTTAPSPVPNSYFLVAENGIGGKALDVFVNNIVYPDDGLSSSAPADAYERVLAAAAASPAGANGIMFQPWLVGSGAPGFARRTRGGFVNLDLNANRVDMARAVLEGVALNVAWLLPHFSALAAHAYTEVSVGGGGAGSALWGQIMADTFGVNVRRLANSRTTNAHGAALLALAQAEAFEITDIPSLLTTQEFHEPQPAAHALYSRRLAAFIDFHDRTAPFYNALNATERTTS